MRDFARRACPLLFLCALTVALSIAGIRPAIAAENKVLLVCVGVNGGAPYALEINLERGLVTYPSTGDSWKAEIMGSTVKWVEEGGNRNDPDVMQISLDRNTGVLNGSHSHVSPSSFTHTCRVSEPKF